MSNATTQAVAEHFGKLAAAGETWDWFVDEDGHEASVMLIQPEDKETFPSLAGRLYVVVWHDEGGNPQAEAFASRKDLNRAFGRPRMEQNGAVRRVGQDELYASHPHGPGGRWGTLYAPKAAISRALGKSDGGTDDGKVKDEWYFIAPSGAASLHDYWWNKKGEWSIGADGPESGRELLAFLLTRVRGSTGHAGMPVRKNARRLTVSMPATPGAWHRKFGSKRIPASVGKKMLRAMHERASAAAKKREVAKKRTSRRPKRGSRRAR